jgi:predicted Zn-dependent peptidase
MGRLGHSLMQRDRAIGVDEQVAAIRAVSSEDVQRVLRRILEAPRALAAVGPGTIGDLR